MADDVLYPYCKCRIGARKSFVKTYVVFRSKC
jgi:hypothetical protein